MAKIVLDYSEKELSVLQKFADQKNLTIEGFIKRAVIVFIYALSKRKGKKSAGLGKKE